MKMEGKNQHMTTVKKFLEGYGSDSTRRNYRIALTSFFCSIFEDTAPRGYNSKTKRVEWLDTQATHYFSEERDFETDMQEFLASLNGRAPKTVKMKIAAVRSFLVENDVEFSQKFWRRLRKKIRGSRALTLDKVPSNSELRKLVMHMPIHGKALYLLLPSSGLRIGEALQLKRNDLNLKGKPAKINVRGEYTKTGNSRVTFASREAKEAIEEWLKVRRGYLESAIKKSHLFEKRAEDARLFPFENCTAYSVWNNALEKAQMDERDESTNYRKMHPHVLRKFFRTRMATLIPVDVTEALMGHEGYLTEVYRRYSMEELAKFYLQGESALLVFTEAGEVTRLRQEVEESKEQLQTLVNTLTSKSMRLEEENMELKHRIEKTETKLEGLEKLIREAIET